MPALAEEAVEGEAVNVGAARHPRVVIYKKNPHGYRSVGSLIAGGSVQTIKMADSDLIRDAEQKLGLLPNLLIIGAPKCGTTSLHHYLDAHPEISMSDVKELDFFVPDRNWANGVDWYRSNFTTDAPVRGESSTTYTRDDCAVDAARLIHEVLGTPKLIYLVRDPIERMRSDYHQFRAVGIEQRPVEEALAEPDNRYLEASRYGSRVAPYVEWIGKENILVESQERLLTDRGAVLSRIFEFVGVRSDFQSAEFARMWERSEGKGWAYGLGWRLRSRGIRLPAFLRWPAQRLQRSRLAGGAAETARPPEISARLRQDLTVALRPEAERLRELTGAEFPEWRLSS